MKLSNTTLLAVLSASVVVAAPAPADKTTTLTVAKRENLVKAVAEFQELKLARAKRADLDTELTTREYAIVTLVLTAIKDTELTPTILKFFVSNETLKSAAITGTEYVIRSGLLSLKSLLLLLVRSGLITDVINDVIGNCEVYASLINVAKGLLSNLFKREDLELGYDGDLVALKRDVLELGNVKRAVPYTHEEGYELLRRDGVIENSDVSDLLEAMKREDLEARDVDDIIINVLESLAASGLALQVVETVLTDPNFITFSGALVKKLYTDGLLSISAIVSAVTQSGLLPALIKELVNFLTISKIATTALSAFDGECLALNSTSTSTSGISSILGSLTSSSDDSTTSDSGSSLIGSLLSSLTDGSDATNSSDTTDSSSSGSSGGLLGLASSLLGGGSLLSGLLGDSTTTATSAATDACATLLSLYRRERMRIY